MTAARGPPDDTRDLRLEAGATHPEICNINTMRHERKMRQLSVCATRVSTEARAHADAMEQVARAAAAHAEEAEENLQDAEFANEHHVWRRFGS